MTLSLSANLQLPVDAVTQTFGFLARRGAGKTYGASKLAEEMHGAGAQVVVLDPVGVWYGLRLAADGKSKGIEIPVLGGLHGDIPLEPGAGALVADLVVDRGISVVLDVSMFRKADRKRFATDFAEQLFHRKKSTRSPVHLFIEEAQVFVPQRAMGDEARMLGAFEDLVKLGRNFGIGVTLISQRPQAVNKDALNQTECLLVLQTNGSQERKALRDWIVDQGLDVGELIDSLPGLKRGEAWVWSPSWLGITKRIHISKKKTFNASATPELGHVQAAPRELEPLDLEQLRVSMKDVVAKATAQDPRALQRRVAQLEAQLAKAPAAAPAKVERVEVMLLREQDAKRLEKIVSEALVAAAALDNGAKELRTAIAAAMAKNAPRPTPSPPRRPAVPPPDAGDVQLRAGERKMLEVLARGYPVKRTPAQLGTLSGFTPSGGTFQQYLRTLKKAGYVVEKDSWLELTADGVAAAGGTPPAPQTTDEVLAMWRDALRAGERAMLDTLVQLHPDSTSKGALGAQTGFTASGGTFQQYLRTLVKNGLAEADGDQVRAGEALFLK